MSTQYREAGAHFQKLYKLGQGSYGEVFLCSTKDNGAVSSETQNSNPNTIKQTAQLQKTSTSQEYFALKKLKMPVKKSSLYQQQPKKPTIEDLRQIQIMRLLSHQNLMPFMQIVHQDKGYQQNYFLVLPYGIELLQFAKQKEIMLTAALRKTIIYQIVTGLKEMHDKGILHRDIKPDNIFLMKNGTVKVGDFSLSRVRPESGNAQNAMVEESHENNWKDERKMSGNVTTRYYRAPQIMYGSRHYDEKIDIWSLGCSIAELILHQPLFPGQTDINQLQLIFKIIGYPQQKWPSANELPYYLQFPKTENQIGLRNILPDIEPQLLDLIEGCLELDPKKRPSTSELLNHKYFANVQKKSFELEKIAGYLQEKKIKEMLSKVKHM